MDLRKQFNKETGQQADEGEKYNDLYIEWLEDRLQHKLQNKE